jgi:uncharacterized protein (DUF1501 family)
MSTRRTILKTMAAAGALAAWDTPIRTAFAAVPTERRFVVVILRGALDGLAVVPPHGDKDYASTRGALALSSSGTNPLHDLDGFFGLHPSLGNVKAMYDAKEVAVFHNICSPYRDRSHFDGQNVLETGGSGPHVLQDGGSIARSCRWGSAAVNRRSPWRRRRHCFFRVRRARRVGCRRRSRLPMRYFLRA